MNNTTDLETIDHEQVVEALRNAMQSHAGSSWDDIDPEAVAVLAQGRGHELPPRERAQLLQRIATDPDLGTLLSQLRHDLGDTVAHPSFFKSRSLLRVAWAASLVALVTAGTIRLGKTPGLESVDVLDSGSGSPSYLEKLGQEPSAFANLASDPIFVALFILAVLLGTGVFWPRRNTES